MRREETSADALEALTGMARLRRQQQMLRLPNQRGLVSEGPSIAVAWPLPTAKWQERPPEMMQVGQKGARELRAGQSSLKPVQ